MKDEWVAAALSDDSVVADLLFRIKQSSSDLAKPTALLSLPQGWGHRQPRSKPPMSSRKDSNNTTSATRFSPTTPLSWSGGADASPSDATCDDYSNSSRSSSDPSRSKGAIPNEITCSNIPSNTKRSRKKKTFAELKEEENLLLKERVNLTRELASLHVTLKQQRVRSENLKRIKFDLNIQSPSEMGGTSGDPMVAGSSLSNQMEEASTSDHTQSDMERHAMNDNFGSSSSRRVEKEVDMKQRCFVLPDLNMMPSEEEIAPDISVWN